MDEEFQPGDFIWIKIDDDVISGKVMHYKIIPIFGRQKTSPEDFINLRVSKDTQIKRYFSGHSLTYEKNLTIKKGSHVVFHKKTFDVNYGKGLLIEKAREVLVKSTDRFFIERETITSRNSFQEKIKISHSTYVNHFEFAYQFNVNK
jgi:hypothetical protein